MNKKKYIKVCILASVLLCITPRAHSMITEDQADSDSEQAIIYTEEEQIVRNAYTCLERKPEAAQKTLCSINKKFNTCYKLTDLKSGSWCVFPDDEVIGITISGKQFFINYEGDWIKIENNMLSDSTVINVYGAFDS